MHYEKIGNRQPVCIEDELPFELPTGWSWGRLSAIAGATGGKTPSTTQRSYWENGSIPWITSKDMKAPILRSSQIMITEEAVQTMNMVPIDSVLIVTRSGILRRTFPVAINVVETTVNQDIKALTPYVRGVSPQLYLTLAAQEKRILSDFTKDGTTVESIDFERLYRMPIPIPPLAEQQRIIAALDELLAKVNTIEREQAELEELLAKTHSKILDLAIRGKLVPQDPNDEPASVLLERIHAEKVQMVAEGKLKKKDIVNDSVIFRGEDNSYYERRIDGTVLRVEDELFSIPSSWSWTRLGTISNYGESPSVSSDGIEEDAWILDLEDIEKDTGRILRKVLKQNRNSSSAKRPFVSGQLLYSKLRPYLNKVLIAPDHGFCTSEILPVCLYGDCVPEYAMLYLRSPHFLQYASRCSYGVKMPRLGTTDGRKAFFALPPLDEQLRIEKIMARIHLALSTTR